MIFKNLFSSDASTAKASSQPNNHSQNALTPTASLQSHETSRAPVIGRVFGGYFYASSSGIKLIPRPLTNKFIHMRLQPGYERLMNMHKELERTKLELKVVRNLLRRQETIANITEQRNADLRLIEIEEHKKEVKNLTEKIEHWQGIASQQEDRVFKMGQDALTLADAALASIRNVTTLRAERDEIRAQLAREKEHAEWTENRQDIALSCLRQRLEFEKAYLQEEVDGLRQLVRKKNQKIAELNDFCEGSVQEVKENDRVVALHQGSEAIESFSHEISCILSEMREVVSLQKEWPNLGEKMKALRDGVKDLVGQIKSRRNFSRRTGRYGEHKT